MKTLILFTLTLGLLLSCGKSGNINNEQLRLIEANLIASTGKKWEDGKTLIVTFADGTNQQKREVENFAPEWSKYANINFKFYPSMDQLPRGTVPDIYITFNGKGNTSTVGTDSRDPIKENKPSMSLSGMSKEYVHSRKSTILHEFGHAIGLNHEHQHPERTFRFDEATALAACMSGFSLTEEACKLHVIKTFSKDDKREATEEKHYFSKYDPYSIMHYTLHAGLFGINNKDYTTRMNDSLSLLDKIEVAKLYPRNEAPWNKGKFIKNIIKEHEKMMAEIQEIKTYKNCSLKESVVKIDRLDPNGEIKKTDVIRYQIVSIAEGDFETRSAWEDKESVVFLMKNTPYCNLSPLEIEERRQKILENKKSEQYYGNCFINIDDRGAPIKTRCDKKENQSTYYTVLKKSNKEFAVELCFSTFKEAVEAQYESEYCNLSSFMAQEADRAQKSGITSLCTIENNVDQKDKKGCSKKAPFYIKRNGKRAINTCYANPTDAISASKELKECR